MVWCDIIWFWGVLGVLGVLFSMHKKLGICYLVVDPLMHFVLIRKFKMVWHMV